MVLSTLSEARTLLEVSQIPIPQYRRTGDLCVICCHFNPELYASRLINYAAFEQSLLRSGIEFVAVEGSFGAVSHQLDTGDNVQRITARSVMWQKERLLNIAWSRVPRRFDKIAWIDADVLFTNPAWATTASQLLDVFPVVQLFHKVIRLPRGVFDYRGVGDEFYGFAAAYSRYPHGLVASKFQMHGHTGFGWAARREVLDAFGLYDASIVGSGDDLMAHAFCGDWDSPCATRKTGIGRPLTKHYQEWAERVYPSVRSRIGYVPGIALHLWHGEKKDRGYGSRHRELQAFDFDPQSDIIIDGEGCWEWCTDKPRLHRWVANYFHTRREDG